MSNTSILVIAGVVVVILAGLVSAGLVALDLKHRRVRSRERLLWIGLALLLPGFGMGVYFLIRILNAFLAPIDSDDTPLWVTRMRRPARPGQPAAPGLARGETIPAADLLRPPAAPAPAAALQVQLRVIDGPESGRRFPLGRLPALIGRGVEAAVALDADITVSRRHAEVYAQRGALRIRDLGSSHGTQVNGFNIQDKSLEIGDRILIGKSLLQVEP